MTIASWVVWSVGLVLQAVLLVLLLRRKTVRRVPVFSALIAFYLIRAGLLFGLSSRVSHEAYQQLVSVLSVTDLGLQFLVMAEIVIYILRNSTAGKPSHRLRSAAFIAGGLAVAICAAALTPQGGRVPIDRGMVVITVIAVLLAMWTAAAKLHGFQRHVAEGFAAYGLIGIIAGIVRNAALHRSVSWYIAASWVQPGIYVCVVVFWIVALARKSRYRAILQG